MTVHDEQITMEEINPEYAAFVEKFKPKKTTDDCYTPENVYDAVADWTAWEYGVERSSFVRPFWPGGDYQRYDYPEGCVVVDNPPFSILSRIVGWYQDHGIRYSDAYEVYGLTRTGCCGCPISSRAVEDLEKIRPFEPNLVKAAWNVFGPSYEYRQKYNAYRAARNVEKRASVPER